MAGGLLGRPERGGDVGVGQVVAVSEDDGGALGARQGPGQVLQLGKGGPRVGRGKLGQVVLRPGTSPLVERDARRDREGPGAKIVRVDEAPVGAQRLQEGLLKGVLRRLAPEQPHEVAVDLLACRLIEALERRGGSRHRWHLLF